MGPPLVSASLALNPRCHSYANYVAPSLILSIISHYDRPITIYADDLSPALMLKCGAFKIISLTSGAEFKQTVSTHCRFPPPTKVKVSYDEASFYTLYPNVPVTFSAPFTRKRDNNDGKPLPASHPDYSNHRYSTSGALGVDGLEPGDTYALTLAETPRVAWTFVRWWEYGTKEEVLRMDLDARKVKFDPGPHEPITVDTSGVKAVAFSCTE
ncbi:uncharacterized protein KY384_006351 [Bacidia gigantensis]|uniref:uncharacterized protein n=1 Tax=Bacidia gigantensis TaxID=2732470 RepID=UPI001D055CFC|nr:uncharacterized protein KY384_006351 [Bacidia gigantensis]KAG8528664.1 hypothetical protein KY384_006351 [Bacidia gigantensis]